MRKEEREKKSGKRKREEVGYYRVPTHLVHCIR
jgi:hypothetical protein